jgi:hypothetical protein
MKRHAKTRITKTRQEFSYEETLDKLFTAATRIIEKLADNARKLMDLAENEPVPEEWAREVRQAIASGLTDWAVRRMGTDIDRFLDEGVRNYLDMFWLASTYSYRDKPWGRGERFAEGLRNARFFIPLKFTRAAVHPREWPALWSHYRNVLETVQKLQSKKKRTRGNYLLALRETLPGIPDKQIDKFSLMKASDIAAEYTCWKFKLAAGPEALKEYFRVFHTQYGYMDFVLKRLANLK